MSDLLRDQPQISRQRRPSRPAGVARLIAVGVNGNPEGRDATVLGAMIARATGAELMLVAVHPDPILVLPAELNWSGMEEQAKAVLRELRDEVAPEARIAVETDYSVARGLEGVVRREHRDLLVVGSSRHGRDGHVRIGTRTRQLLGDAPCTLAVAPRGLSAVPSGQLASIGAGYEGGQESQAALVVAGALGRAGGAKLRVRAVVDNRLPPVGSWTRPIERAERDERVDAALGSLRDDAEAAASATGADVHVEVVQGSPPDELKRLSREVDLLVIGSRRWGAAARVLLGSMGEEVMRDASCAVMVVPRPAR
jgi:nucleotide-binding universal stress UspA family protein